ncbi:MAG: hypothetical protein JSU91_06530 [Thermoplasmatales archaeon]|nr:MAG: hypothetical protein JSU91_06530 [Thermoplasmatales archaeon]
MNLGKEKIIPIFAMIVLFIGIFSTIYVHANQIEKDTISINGQDYTIDQLFSIGKIRVIETDEGEKTGISLDELMSTVGVGCTDCYKYTIKAKDGYQQTVDWTILKTGILTDYGKVYFPNTAHTLWVRDVIEIEVK